MGFQVAEKRIGVGLLSEKEVCELTENLSQLDKTDTAVVFDLHGNLAYRFEQVDGTTALPVNIGGRYHLLGEIKVAEDRVLQNMIDRTVKLFRGESDLPTLVLPPLPRFIGGGCCSEIGHSTNASDNSYKETMIEKIRHMRKVYKKALTGKECKAWIGDPVGMLTGKDQCSNGEAVGELEKIFAQDRVHLTPDGYKRLAEGIVKGIEKAASLNKSRASASRFSGTGTTWHGITSRVGSRTPEHEANWKPRAWRGRASSGLVSREWSGAGKRALPYHQRPGHAKGKGKGRGRY